MSSPPARLISDGNRFYEVPVPPSSGVGPSPVDLDPNPAMEANLLLATPISSSAAGAGVGAGGHYPPRFLSALVHWYWLTRGSLLSKLPCRMMMRAQIEAYIRISLWFRVHALEFLVGESGVPLSALQLAKRGCFVKGGSSLSALYVATRATDCIVL